MYLELILFYAFSAVAIISGLMVIRAENPVHSVLFLILTFFNTSGLLLLLEVEFLAMVFLVVYVGAIAVLFILPWLDKSPIRSSQFRPIYKLFFWILVFDCILLGYLGAKPA